MSTPAFEWGDPGVSIPLPPTRKPIPVEPTPWNALTFTPLGAYEVHRHLGVTLKEKGLFNVFRDKFLASDLAFLAAGASKDGHHMIKADKFFTEFHELYESLPQGSEGQKARREFGSRVRTLIFDLATQLDRVTGGTTMVIHSTGTTVPNAPLDPEHLKAQVYLPPQFLREHPEAHAAIAFLVQTYIEHVGIPTARDWQTHVKKIWSLMQRSHLGPVDLPTTLIPNPAARSAHYIFKGRLWGTLRLEVPPASSAGATAPAAQDSDQYDFVDATFNDNANVLMNALERVDQLEMENRSLRKMMESLPASGQTSQSDFEEQERGYQAKLDMITASVSRLKFFQREWMERENGYRAEQDLLTQTVQRLEDEIRASRVSISSLRSPAPRSQCPAVTTPACPPSYTHFASPSTPNGSRLGSPAPHGVSTWRNVSSAWVVATGDEDSLTPHTDRFLAEHALMHLSLMVDLWSDELRLCPELMPDLVGGFLKEMDKDRLAAPL